MKKLFLAWGLILSSLSYSADFPIYVRYVNPAFTPPNLFLLRTRAVTAFFLPGGTPGSTFTFTYDATPDAPFVVAAGDIPFTFLSFDGGPGCDGAKSLQFTLQMTVGGVTTNLGTTTQNFVAPGFVGIFNPVNVFTMPAITQFNNGDTVQLIMTNVGATNFCLVNEFPIGGVDTDASRVVLQTTPRISVQKTSSIVDDPINGTTNPKAIPSANVRYTIDINNSGSDVTDTDSLTIEDTLPPEVLLRFGAAGNRNPFTFNDSGSGLTFNFLGLGDPTDSVDFFNNGGTTLVTPVIDAQDLDATVPPVDRVIITPQGQFNNSITAPFPSFQIQFDAEIQ